MFGTCLGAIVAYEVARRVQERKHAPSPVAFFPSAVSAPHLYAIAVMKLYVQHQVGADRAADTIRSTDPCTAWSQDHHGRECCADYDEPPPLEEVMAFLATWDKVPTEQLLAVFERGHFAGVEEMKRNERLFNRVAPMGVNDIAMACQYKFTPAAALTIPVTSFEGLADNTIDPGASHPQHFLLQRQQLEHVSVPDEASGMFAAFGLRAQTFDCFVSCG